MGINNFSVKNHVAVKIEIAFKSVIRTNGSIVEVKCCPMQKDGWGKTLKHHMVLKMAENI